MITIRPINNLWGTEETYYSGYDLESAVCDFADDISYIYGIAAPELTEGIDYEVVQNEF